MTSYGIGDVEALLGLKVHVIRYWEKEIPLVQPKRDHIGRRLYSPGDLRIFLRLKHLLYDRRFTLEGAREELFRELSGSPADLRGHIDALRSDLLELYFTVHAWEADLRHTGTRDGSHGHSPIKGERR